MSTQRPRTHHPPALPFLLLTGLMMLLLGCLALSPRTTGAATPSAAPTAARPNVIFIVVDALRADHVSAYGYERPTTPYLDSFVVGGVRFERATSPSSWTFPSNAAMLTARMPSRIRMSDWGSLRAKVPGEEVMLAELLRAGGYETIGFVNNYYLDAQFGMDQGFDHYERLVKSEMAGDLNAMAFDWLSANPAAGDNQPLFLFMYYYDPHSWYDPPPPYDTLYDSTYTGPLTPEVYQHGQKVVSGEIVPTPRDVEHLIALYDGEITYWDYQLAHLLARLDGDGLLDNALVVITSDHGQMFGEHGKWVHRNSLYEEVLRVPLFLHYPGVVPANAAIDTPVFTADLPPTILDLVGLPVPPALDGRSLRPLIQGQRSALDDRPIYAEMEGEPDPDSPGHWIAPMHDLRAVTEDNWKYVMAVGAPQDNALYRLRPDTVYEGANVIAEYPQEAERLHQDVFDWFRMPTSFTFMSVVKYQ